VTDAAGVMRQDPRWEPQQGLGDNPRSSDGGVEDTSTVSSANTPATSEGAQRQQFAARGGAVGAALGVAALVGFRRWEAWEREQECTGIFAECMNQSLRPLSVGLPLLVLAAWLALWAVGLGRTWLVVLVAAPLNVVLAVASHDARPRVAAVAVVSAMAWAVGGLLAKPRRALQPGPGHGM
jgi:hypothetical protein